jgi:hypothetical protein
MKESDKVALEVMIDKYNLETVLEVLADICGEKAQHIRESYSDNPLAEHWDRMAGEIGAISL